MTTAVKCAAWISSSTPTAASTAACTTPGTRTTRSRRKSSKSKAMTAIARPLLPRWAASRPMADRKRTRLNSSHSSISYTFFLFLMTRPPPRSPLLPYTALFRSQKILEIEGYDRYRAPFIAEMGGIQTDGQRTLLTTEQCLLNRNRNAHLGKEEMTRRLSDYLGAEQVIWLPRGCKFDETDGHIDDLACFVRPGVVVQQWTDDRSDPQWEIYQEAYDILRSTSDAQGRAL